MIVDVVHHNSCSGRQKHLVPTMHISHSSTARTPVAPFVSAEVHETSASLPSIAEIHDVPPFSPDGLAIGAEVSQIGFTT